MYALVPVEKKEEPFGFMGFDEAQILEIAQAEKVIQYLIDQYILNQRLKCFSLEASN